MFNVESGLHPSDCVVGITTNPWVKPESAVLKTYTLLTAMITAAFNVYLFYAVVGFNFTLHTVWYIGASSKDLLDNPSSLTLCFLRLELVVYSSCILCRVAREVQ